MSAMKDMTLLLDLFKEVPVYILIASTLLWIGKKHLISSENKFKHTLGIIAGGYIPLVFLIECVLSLLIDTLKVEEKWWELVVAFSILVLAVYVTIRFIRVFRFDNRYTRDAYNHTALTLMLLGIGIFIVYLTISFGLNSTTFIPFGLCAAVLSWIFQDAIKGVVAYYHLRFNNLLHIGDWIEVPSHQIDGTITDISLVTVTVRNWDNTISNVAISSLVTGAFKNNQEMSDGKTSGRQMVRSFVIDTRSIRTFGHTEITGLRDKLERLGEDAIVFDHHMENAPANPVLNIYLFRMYLRHWLMNHKEVTRYPNLIVRLLEPTAEGIPLQLYTYIVKTGTAPFELAQSHITEHVILSMEWFGLRLYQQPSGEDIYNQKQVEQIKHAGYGN